MTLTASFVPPKDLIVTDVNGRVIDPPILLRAGQPVRITLHPEHLNLKGYFTMAVELIHYECRIHGRVDRIVAIRHRPCCAVCRDTVLLRFKWTPTVADPTRRRVTRSIGVDASRPVQVIARF